MQLRFRLAPGALVVLAVAAIAPNAFAAAQVRLMHAAPDVPAVTVYVNGQAAVPSLATLTATDYLSLPAGSYDVAISLAGRPLSEAALTAKITLEDGKRYTGLARGLIAQGTAELALQEDIFRAPFGRSGLRVWHLSPDAPNVDIIVNGQTVLRDVPYKAASDYLTVPAGTYNVQVNVAGTTTSVFQGSVELKSGEAYTAVAWGAVAAPGKPFTVAPLLDARSAALVRVLHAIPDVPAVSVYVNNALAVRSVSTLKATGYLTLDTYNVAVSLRGRPASSALLRARITVETNTRYTALAQGLAARRTAKLAVQKDINVAPSGKSALRVWHLSPDAPRVDVYVNNRKVLSRLCYGTASPYLTLAPGSYNVRVTVAGTRTAVFSGRVQTRADRAYSAVALGTVKAKGLKFRVSALQDA